MSRILVVAPWFPSQRKPGAAPFIWRDTELLRESHEVTVIHLANNADVDPVEPRERHLESGIQVVQVPFNSLAPASLWRAQRVIRNHLRSADGVHTMAFHALLAVHCAAPRVPWIHTEHWSGLTQSSLGLKKQLGRAAYRPSLMRPNQMVAVGEELAISLRPYTQRNIRVIPNHVTLGSAENLPAVPETRGASPLRLVAVGNMIHHKGPLQAVEALKDLHDRGITATLTWIGAGPLLEDVARRGRELGIDKWLSLPGQVAPENIAARLRQGHVFVLPTLSETFGVAFAEALGQGLPVIATGTGEHLRFLPAAASRIVAERTPTAIADAIVSLISDNARWAPARIVDYARAQFSEDARRAAYRAVYSDAGMPQLAS